MLPLLALHGFLGRGTDWAAVAGRLDRGVRVLLPDLPGHGAARNDPPQAFAMDVVADRLAASLGGGQAVVAGYSMGGRIALHLALRHPERVAALVLLSASPGLRTEPERAERRRVDAQRAEALVADPAAFLDAWYRMPLWDGMDEATRAALTADRLAHADPAALARALDGLGTGRQPSLWEPLADLRVPTWAVAGARDDRYVRVVREMASAGPVTPVVVPDAGHALLAEAPAAVASVLHTALHVASLDPLTHA